MQCSEPQGVAGGEKGGNGGSEGRKVASIASSSPVGSAKFGPRVGAIVVANVGGLVSPTLVGAGVGTRVGAAHAHTRTVRVQIMCPERPPQCWRTGALLCTRYSALGVPVEYPARSASQVPLRAMPLAHPRVHAVVPHTCPALRAVGPRRGAVAHRTVRSTARVSTL